MKFLCLAYGDEKDWKALSKREQDELLTGDEELRRRGAMVAVLEPAVTVRPSDRTPSIAKGPFAQAKVPLVGFSLTEARDLDEVVSLVSKMPCAVAKGATEVWPIRGT